MSLNEDPITGGMTEVLASCGTSGLGNLARENFYSG